MANYDYPRLWKGRRIHALEGYSEGEEEVCHPDIARDFFPSNTTVSESKRIEMPYKIQSQSNGSLRGKVLHTFQLQNSSLYFSPK